MNQLIKLLDHLTPYGTHSYFFIFGILIACGFGLPMPEDILLVTGGVLASRGVINLHMIIAVTLVGVLVGDGMIFSMGKFFGPKLKNKKLFQFILPPDRDVKVANIIRKYGEKVIFMARFMPGLRTPIFFTTGTYQIPFWKFMLFDGVAAIVSVPTWVYIGFLFGSNLEQLEYVIKKFQWGIYGVIAALVLIVIGILYVRKVRVSKV